MDMSFGIDTLLTVIAGVFALIGVWTKLSSRLAILETKLDFGDEKFQAIDKKFDEVMMHLRRIEDKLDNKADKMIRRALVIFMVASSSTALFAQSNNYVYDTTTNSTATNTNVNTSTSTATNNNFNTDVSTSTINQTVNSTSNSTVNSTNLNTNRNFNESTSTATNTNRNFNESSSTSVSTATNVNTNLSTSTSESVNTNVNTNISDSRSVSTNVNTNTSVSESKNLNTNTNVSDSKSTSYSESQATQSVTQKITSPPPSAIAPSMMSYSQDLCTTGVSGAVQTQILGISGGKTIRDKNCEALKLSKTLYDMGMRVAAVSLLCQDERVFDAMKMAGTPCPYQGKIGKEAAAAWEENKPKRSSRR